MSSAQTPDQLYQTEQEAIRLSEEIKAEYWAVSAKSGGRSAGGGVTPQNLHLLLSLLCSR